MVMAAGGYDRTEAHMMRHAAHQIFDRFWAEDVPGVTVGYQITKRCRRALRREWPKRRAAAYAWLADQLDLPAILCHFGHFDAATLERVIALCRAASADEVCGFLRQAQDRAA